MANVYNEDVVEATLIFENNADATRATNNLYFFCETVVNESSLIALAGALESWIDVEWQPIGSIVWKSVGVAIRQMKAPPAAVYETTWSYTGAITGTAPANNVTFAMSLRTGFTGRSYRGRLYHVGLAEEDITNSYLDNTVIASMVEAYEAIGTAALAVDWTWGVYSRYSNGSPRATGQFTPIQSVIHVDNIVDTQRRRLPRS